NNSRYTRYEIPKLLTLPTPSSPSVSLPSMVPYNAGLQCFYSIKHLVNHCWDIKAKDVIDAVKDYYCFWSSWKRLSVQIVNAAS
nr:hypothetical protein [Tanacetum cinerariifolium]